MIQFFLIVLGSYGLCVTLIHVWYSRRSDEPQVIHYVLITNNHQTQIEWYVRYFLFRSWVKGRETKITVAEQGSTEETLEIANRLSYKKADQIQTVRYHKDLLNPEDWKLNEKLVIIHLSAAKDHRSIPAV
jgi:hypothetical protein